MTTPAHGVTNKVLLCTDVDLLGIHTLTLSGDAFCVWQSANHGMTNAATRRHQHIFRLSAKPTCP